MNNNIPVITDKKELYDKCENMEQLFDKYYLPLLDKHYSKVYQLQQENQKLKKQLEYLRSGEYYNQLRFENEMLQQVVDTNGVPSEVYDYIDCTHRNTELLEENQKLKKQIEEYKKWYQDELEENSKLSELWCDSRAKIRKLENQQKEFISYLESEIDRLEKTEFYIDSIQKAAIETHKHNLSKYKEIIGSDINVGSIGGKE